MTTPSKYQCESCGFAPESVALFEFCANGVEIDPQWHGRDLISLCHQCELAARSAGVALIGI